MNQPSVSSWVEKRAACSMDHVFGVLREVVDSDVNSANSLKRPRIRFGIQSPAVNKIIVSRMVDTFGDGSHIDSTAIVFELRPNDILVKEGTAEGKARFTARPVLTSSQECLLSVDQIPEPQHPWQVSRKALEDLFFNF